QPKLPPFVPKSFTFSGGRLSPSQSRPLSTAQIVFVFGFTASPTALRNPEAKRRWPLPSSLYSVTAARRGSSSLQTLQLDPAATYIFPFQKIIARVECPPPLPGRSAIFWPFVAFNCASSQS